jgi:hypothetical protein
MLDLNKRLQGARLEHEKTLLSRQVEATAAANWPIQQLLGNFE